MTTWASTAKWPKKKGCKVTPNSKNLIIIRMC